MKDLYMLFPIKDGESVNNYCIKNDTQKHIFIVGLLKKFVEKEYGDLRLNGVG